MRAVDAVDTEHSEELLIETKNIECSIHVHTKPIAVCVQSMCEGGAFEFEYALLDIELAV